MLVENNGFKNYRDNSLTKADLYLNISERINNYTGLDYLEKLIHIFTVDMGIDFGYVYEVSRDSQYTLFSLAEHNKSNIVIELNNSLINYLIQNDCYKQTEKKTNSKDSFKELNDLDFFISICLYDSENKSIGLLVLGSVCPVNNIDIIHGLLMLFRSRVASELERFRLQFSLEYTRDQARYISDHSRDMIWNIDNQGIYTYVNRACFDIYGYEASEMVGQPYSKFIHKKMLDEFNKLIAKTTKDDEVHKLITQHETNDGYPVKLICTTKSLHDKNGKVTGVSGTSTDITEFIRSQVLFKNNNELFSKVLSRLPVIFFRINEDANIIDIRGSGLKRLRVKDMEWVDKSCYGLFVGKDELIDAVLHGGTESFESSGVVGGEAWSFFVSMFFDSWSGFGAIGFCVDISEQKNNEKKLEQLLREKRDLNQRLVTIQEEERRSLARELHDEFGQSITAVKSLAKAITEFSGEQYSETRSLSNSIVDLSGKLYEVVNDMMRRLRPEILDTLGLEEAIKNCIDRSHLEIEGIVCNVEFIGDLLSLDEVVKITVYRIIQECLTNISKYAMASNVNILISRTQSQVEQRKSRDRNTNNEQNVRDVLYVNVKDDGIGMDINKSFEKTAHKNRMGLQGMEERLIALGGSLHISSEPYKGVKIEAEMPLSLIALDDDSRSTTNILENV